MSETQQKISIKCENENCKFFGKSESDGGSFIAVIYYEETHDFELSEDGTLGRNLTVKENENLHIGFRVRDIRCRHCDEDITMPAKWTTEFEDTFPEDFTTIGVTKNEN